MPYCFVKWKKNEWLNLESEIKCWNQNYTFRIEFAIGLQYRIEIITIKIGTSVVFEIVNAFTMKYRIEITTKMNIDTVVEIDIDETIRSILQFKLIVNYKTENEMK